jgi:hypothetical protein
MPPPAKGINDPDDFDFVEDFDDEGPGYDPAGERDPTEVQLDSEVDFDDEAEDDQLPLDEVEAAELGVDLDDPDRLADDENGTR